MKPTAAGLKEYVERSNGRHEAYTDYANSEESRVSAASSPRICVSLLNRYSSTTLLLLISIRFRHFEQLTISSRRIM